MSADCVVAARASKSRAIAAEQIAAKDLLCLTVYNEPVAELQRSLTAVASALDFLAVDDAIAAREFGVSIIIDGARCAHQSVLAWLQQVDLLESVNSGWHFGFISLSELSARAVPAPLKIPVWVYIKAENRGKLDSHAQFFDRLCALLNPQRVYQLDVGTTIAPTALRETIATFIKNDNVGAISSRCAAVAPSIEDGIVPSWQFFDTTQQLSSQWPIECLTGYLSVIPGQFCAFRWNALYQNGASDSPLRHYLRGVDASSLYEKIMFLAEDRIIGQALTLAENKEWRIEYGVGVKAENDACATLPELMRQRRRWNNGANACRLDLLLKWPRLLLRHDRSPTQKAKFSLAMLWQLVLFLSQVLAPVCFVASTQLLLTSITIFWQQGSYFLPLVLLVCITLAIFSSHSDLRLSQPSLLLTLRLALRDYGWWGALLSSIALLVDVVSFKSALILVLWQFLPLLITTSLYPTKRNILWRRYAEYFWLNPFMSMLQWAYSLATLGNTTWGTKGLRNSRAVSIDLRTAWALPLWIIVNVLVGWYWLRTPGMVLSDMPLLKELSVLVGCVGVIGSLIFFGAHAINAVTKRRTEKAQLKLVSITSSAGM